MPATAKLLGAAGERILTSFAKGNISVRLTSTLSALNSLTKALSTHLLVRVNPIHSQSKGSFRQAAFDACGCRRSVQCGKIENFLSLRKRNHLPNLNLSDAARVNQP